MRGSDAFGRLISVGAIALAHFTGTGASQQTANVYANPTYAFSCRIPVGWVLRTGEMNAGNDPAKSQVLLAAFERPPEASGPDPASTIVIATESQSTYPSLKTAEDYFAPLPEVVTAKGFQPVNDPYQFPVGASKLVREDFSREQKDQEQKDRPTMYQSTLGILSHGAIVSFTFLAASEDEVNSLIANLSFNANPAPKSSPKSAPAKKPKSPENHSS